MRFASVILDIPTQALDAPYTYLVPDDLSGVEVGCAVLVPFGRRKAVGFVVCVSDDPAALPSLAGKKLDYAPADNLFTYGSQTLGADAEAGAEWGAGVEGAVPVDAGAGAGVGWGAGAEGIAEAGVGWAAGGEDGAKGVAGSVASAFVGVGAGPYTASGPCDSRVAYGSLTVHGEGDSPAVFGMGAPAAQAARESHAAHAEQAHYGFGAQYEAASPHSGFSRDRFSLDKLKPIEDVLSKPYFDEEGAACAQYLAERYIAPLSACVRLFTPPGGVPRMVRTREGCWRLEQPAVSEVDDRWVTLGPAAATFEPRKNAVKQAAVIDALRRGDLRMAELALEFGSVSSTVKSLAEKGVVRIERRRRMRGFEQRAEGAGASGAPVRVGLPACAPVAGACEGGGALDAAQGEFAEGLVEGAACAAAVAGAAIPANLAAAAGAVAPAPGTPAGTPALGAFPPSASKKPQLTAGQRSALRAIADARAAAQGEVVLVDGVTGSGKTEVYLQAIEAELREGRNAIVLVPEISLTPQTVARFRGRFGDLVAVMHSRMSQGERYDQWDFIRCGQARVVVGARSALFTPMANVGLIVIDEEHEGSYKQDSAPRYDARSVAAWMVARSGGTLVLGSATPSIESMHAAATEVLWTQVALPERANGRPLPQIEVVDMAAEFHGGSRAMFSGRLVRALAQELSQGRKVVLLLNQRGFAKFLLCRDCGFVPACPSCSTSLTYHEQGGKLTCHHCGHTVAVPALCPECNSPYLKKFGAGTQRVEAELRALLDGLPGVGPNVPVIRMDADTTRAKGAHQRLLEQFAASEAAVLLGTQMIAKGLDFDDVTLVGVINADTQLHLPDYRAGERTFALIEQVAGRAGRAGLPGRVLVQTYEADSVAIRAAASYDRAMFLRSELPRRRMLGYPPYVRMANVLVWGKDEQAVSKAAAELHDDIEALVRDYARTEWTVLPAAPCVLEKLRGTFRWHVLVKCPRDDDMSRLLARLFRSRKADSAVNVAVDVDPNDLL